jgi:hypothetical protein
VVPKDGHPADGSFDSDSQLHHEHGSEPGRSNAFRYNLFDKLVDFRIKHLYDAHKVGGAAQILLASASATSIATDLKKVPLPWQIILLPPRAQAVKQRPTTAAALGWIW